MKKMAWVVTLGLLASHCIFAAGDAPSADIAGLVSVFEQANWPPNLIHKALEYYQQRRRSAILAQIQTVLDPYSLTVPIDDGHMSRGAFPVHHLENLSADQLAVKIQKLRESLQAADQIASPTGSTGLVCRAYDAWRRGLSD